MAFLNATDVAALRAKGVLPVTGPAPMGPFRATAKKPLATALKANMIARPVVTDPNAFIGLASSSNMNDVMGSVKTLNRKLFDDYYNNYKGREDNAYSQAFGTDFVGEAQKRARISQEAANQAGVATAEDVLARYGQAQSTDQSAATRALQQLSAGGRMVGAGNEAKWEAISNRDDLQDQLLNDYMSRMAGGVNAANNVGLEAAQRVAAYKRYKAAKRSKGIGALTTAIGIIAAPFTGGASLALAAGGLSGMSNANAAMKSEASYSNMNNDTQGPALGTSSLYGAR